MYCPLCINIFKFIIDKLYCNECNIMGCFFNKPKNEQEMALLNNDTTENIIKQNNSKIDIITMEIRADDNKTENIIKQSDADMKVDNNKTQNIINIDNNKTDNIINIDNNKTENIIKQNGSNINIDNNKTENIIKQNNSHIEYVKTQILLMELNVKMKMIDNK